MKWKIGVAALVAAVVAGGCSTIYSTVLRDNEPFDPFEMAPGLYYVGSSDIAVFAIESGDEIALIDAGYKSTAKQVMANLATLCRKTQRLCLDRQHVRYILNTHAHMDHAEGISALQAATGATVVASKEGAKQLKAGGRGDFYLGDLMTYPRIKAVQEIADGEPVPLGQMTITAHLTPGHTRGCTSWSFTVKADGREVPALVNCSLSTLTYDLDGSYPGIAADFAGSFKKLRALPCDFFLGAHGKFFKLKEKREKQMAQLSPNPFVAKQTCTDYLDQEETAFRRKLKAYVPKSRRPPGY
jgi:metallo-beta-lactamase class B